jgi:autotransporter strand-loop-strand O-heptosyltransferase
MKINVNFVNGALCEILDDNNQNQYYVQFINKKTNEIIYDDVIKPNMWVKSSYCYFIDYKVRIIDFKSKKLIREIDYNADSKNVFIWFDSKSLGDSISWIPFVEEFRLKHNCTVYCSTHQNEIFESIYPHIKFVEPGKEVHDLYASYNIGCFDPTNKSQSSVDYRTQSLQQIASDILGLDNKEIKSKIYVKDKERKLKEKYVCISTSSTAGCKHWQYLNGWQSIVNYLNNHGYKVVVIQKEELNYMDLKTLTNVIHPQTLSIHDAISWIYNCDFFIGLSSGNSWLAWALDKKVVMISGFTKPFNEFFTPYRIINENVCHGCWNDSKYKFDRGDWNWCPKLKGTDRQFECSKYITSETVIDKISQIIKYDK